MNLESHATMIAVNPRPPAVAVEIVWLVPLTITNPALPQIATQYGLNENASDVILGIILFFLIGAEFFINYRVKRTKK